MQCSKQLLAALWYDAEFHRVWAITICCVVCVRSMLVYGMYIVLCGWDKQIILEMGIRRMDMPH